MKIGIGVGVAYSHAVASGPQDPAAPIISGVPTIAGIIRVGETATANYAAASGFPAPSFAGQWFRGATEVGTGQSYTFVEADEGETFTFVQTVTNSEGSDDATSAATVAVAAALVAPSISGQPTITGTAQVGQTLTLAGAASSGSPTPTDTYALVHSVDGTVHTGLAAYLIPEGAEGGTYTLQQTASNGVLPDATASSDATAVVQVEPPFNPVPVPAAAGLIPADAATFDVATGWTVPADITITGGQAVRSAGTTNQNLDFSAAGFVPTPGVTSGREYVFYTDLENIAGTVLNSWTAPTAFNAPGSFGSTRRVFMPMTATDAHGAARFRPNGTFRGAINEAQVYDITDQAAAPLDIYICAGQSNMVGASGETGFATAASVERRALILSGFESTAQGRLTDGSGPTINPNLGIGFGVGMPTPIADPTPHSSLNAVGVSPVTAMATAICNGGTEAGRTPLFIAAGDGGSRIDVEWNPDGDARAWDLMIAQIDYALSLNPANRVRGMFWCQGESNRSADPSAYAPQLNDRVDRLRTAYGNFPVVIMEIGGDPESQDGSTGPNTAAMILEQQKLETGSGDASELTDCAYVARPVGWALETDATHFTATTNVVRGQDAAAAMIGFFSGEPVAGDVVTFDGEPVTFGGENVTFTPA